jgi:hypothetical protein
VLLTILNVLPVGAVIVRVKLVLVPLAALAKGLAGVPAAVRIVLSIAFSLAGEAVEYEPLLSIASVSIATWAVCAMALPFESVAFLR